MLLEYFSIIMLSRIKFYGYKCEGEPNREGSARSLFENGFNIYKNVS